jgi:RNA polymerase sigma-70 factor (ECF subfamily)
MASEKFVDQILELDPSLKAFAYHLTKDKEDANDLIQETHYRAISNEDKFAKGTNIKAWLFTIMKNIFINNYRKKSRRKTVFDNTEDQYLLKSAPAMVGNKAESNLMMDDLQRAINNLDMQYRKPFMMHYLGYKYQEIAEEMELPLGTVKSRIFFARKLLKEELGPKIKYRV